MAPTRPPQESAPAPAAGSHTCPAKTAAGRTPSRALCPLQGRQAAQRPSGLLLVHPGSWATTSQQATPPQARDQLSRGVRCGAHRRQVVRLQGGCPQPPWCPHPQRYPHTQLAADAPAGTATHGCARARLGEGPGPGDASVDIGHFTALCRTLWRFGLADSSLDVSCFWLAFTQIAACKAVQSQRNDG